ncbi:hypothetical protein BJ970_006463 [Saccharopolyspora phatthalungensis]|uniref:Uncharacterized protein n=1 Tax=Saccharopolyspora phatthalungensis TaxID=664693 RepID=A0A840QDK9_9PSEU|nr:hypothetical protein [Saccharopolyspora phatthalungensis]
MDLGTVLVLVAERPGTPRTNTRGRDHNEMISRHSNVEGDER